MNTTKKSIPKVGEESHYRLLIEQTSDTICIADASLQFIEVNPSGCRMLGYSREEALQLFLADVLFEEDLITNPLQIDEIISGKLVSNERRIKRKDGTAIEVELSGKMMEGGRLMFFGRDITERKKAQKELEAAYIEKNDILESITDGFFAVDNNSIVTYWNKRAEVLLNAKREDVIGKNLHEMFARPGSMAFYDNYQKATRRNTTVHFEEFSERSQKWFAVSAFASANGLSVYFKDVTDRKVAQEKIKESELRYRSLVEQATDAICITDASMKIIEINPCACQMLGYSKEEFLKLTIADLFVADDFKTNPFKMEELRSGKVVSNERRFKRKDGTLVDTEINAKILEDGRFVVFARDITERKQAEIRLQESNERFNLVSKATSDMVWDWDLETGIVYRNKEGWKKIFGTDIPETETGTKEEWDSKVHPEDRYKVQMVRNEIDNSGNSFFEVECRMLRDDGSYIYIHDRGNIIRNEHGKPVRLIGATQDITERKEAELQVAKSELRFRSLIQNGSDLTNILDEKGYYLYTSPAAVRILGYEPEELVGKNSFGFIHPDDINSIKERLSTKGNEKFRELSPFRFKNAKGEWRWLESKVTDMSDNPEIRGYVFNSRDVTERKKAEDEIKKLSVIARETVNGVVITDPEGRIVWVNEAFTRITEFNVEEVLGKKPGDFLQGEETSPGAVQFMRAEMKKSEPFECDIINYSRSGRKYWVRIQCQPQFDEGGKLLHFFAIQTDITDKIFLEHELENERRLKQQEITEAVITAQEKERQQLGSELHDNIIQILAGSRLYLGLAEKELKVEYPYLRETDKLIKTAVTEIRNLSHALIPPSLNESELIGAIENIVKVTQQTSGIVISLQAKDIDETNLTDKLKLCIYRIIQEQFNNILKHAVAQNVIVLLVQDNEKTLLSIKDDGIGFDTAKKPEGVGLLNIKTRASLFNGELTIITSTGNGCELRVLFN